MIERRTFGFDQIRIERRGAKQTPVIVGHAAVFDSLSEDLGGFQERIAPGAFTEALSKPDDVRALWNHNPDIILGRNMSGTLKLSQDTRGLAIEIDPPDTQTIRDLVIIPMERGDVTQMSFAFSLRPGGEDWAKDDEGRTIRTIKKVRLFDVSPVTYPAYPATDVSIATRAMNEWLNKRGEAANWQTEIKRKRLQLAECSVSSSQAKHAQSWQSDIRRRRMLLARVVA